MREIQEKSQYMNKFINIEVIISLYRVYITMLDPNKPLRIYNPAENRSNQDWQQAFHGESLGRGLSGKFGRNFLKLPNCNKTCYPRCFDE